MTSTFDWARFYSNLYAKLDLNDHLPRVIAELNDPHQTGALTMLAFIKKYAKAVVAAIGYAASISTALGLTHYHWVSIVLGVLSTIAVIITRNVPTAAKPHAGSPAPDRG